MLISVNLDAWRIDTPSFSALRSAASLDKVQDVKMAYSSLGSLFLSIKGYEISKACYQHFLMGHGEPLNDDLLRKIGDAVSESVPFRNRILKNAPSGKRFWIDIPKKTN